jgi:putative acetyltransferase
MPPRSGITLRPYDAADLDAVIAVFLGAIREIAARDYSPAEIDAWAQADRNVWASRRLDRPTWVAVQDRAIVGFSDLEPDGHLDMMFVHPAWQGRGIASLLLSTIETSALTQGLPRLFTEASVTARPFFERRGFRVVTAQRVHVHGQVLTNYRMVKELAGAWGPVPSG